MTTDLFFIRVRKDTEGKEKYSCIMAQAVTPSSHHGGPGSVWSQSMLDLW